MNGPSDSRKNEVVHASHAFGRCTRYTAMAVAMTPSMVHGIDVTFSAKPSGSRPIQSADKPDIHGCSGFGARDARRSSPRALLLHNTGAPRLRASPDEAGTAIVEIKGDRPTKIVTALAKETRQLSSTPGTCQRSCGRSQQTSRAMTKTVSSSIG